MKFKIKGEYQYVNPFRIKSTEPLIFATAGMIEGNMEWYFEKGQKWYCRLEGASANRILKEGIEHFATLVLKVYASKHSAALIGTFFMAFKSVDIEQIEGELCVHFQGKVIGGAHQFEKLIGSCFLKVVNGVVIDGEGSISLPKSK